jgi:acyl-coenzyme A synthetase/AMP-(fatty) acid ligase
VVAILIADKIFHAATMLALMRLGVTTVSARHEKLPKELGVDVAVTDAPRAFENVGRVIVADQFWSAGDGKPLADASVYRTDPDALCRIILTSGTTGEVKGVAFSHRMMVERIQHYDVTKGPGFPFCERVYCDLGLTSAPGFRTLLYMLYRGGTVFFYGEDPVSTLQGFDLYKVQAMIASPYALAEYLKFFEAHGDFHCGFDYISAVGGIVGKTLSERIRARMGSNLVFSYGATEVGSVAGAPAHLVADIPGAVGHVAPWVTVQIADASGRALSPGQEGAVRIRGPFNVSGYVGDPQASARAFRDGWFYPGDLGRLTEAGVLVITGREDAVLNVGGDKVSPELTEEALMSFAGISDAAVFSLDDEFGIGVLCAGIVATSPWDENAVLAHCARHVTGAYVPARVVAVDRIPRNQSGKIDRQALKEQALRQIAKTVSPSAS